MRTLRIIVFLGFALATSHAFTRMPPLATQGGVDFWLSRRAVITSIPRLSKVLPAAALISSSSQVAAAASTAQKTPVGYRKTQVIVGGESIPVAQWYPLSADQPNSSGNAAATDKPYEYRIGIANLFKAFLGFKPPFPSPLVRSGDAAVRDNGAAVARSTAAGGIIFAHGMLGSRFDMATLCETLAREGFVVSAADFAESISASFAPNSATSRSAIIDAEMSLLAQDFGVQEFGIFGHSAGGGSATMTQGPFTLGRCAIAGVRPYVGSDPLYIVASSGDGVIPIDRVRMALTSDMKVASDPADINWKLQRSAALLIDGPVRGADFAPNHISFLDYEANAALVKVLSPLLPLARLLGLPTLDFAVYKDRLDAKQTAEAVRPSIVEFFTSKKKRR